MSPFWRDSEMVFMQGVRCVRLRHRVASRACGSAAFEAAHKTFRHGSCRCSCCDDFNHVHARAASRLGPRVNVRSEEHTSELQSQFHIVCRLLLEKKKTSKNSNTKDNRTINDKPHHNPTYH